MSIKVERQKNNQTSPRSLIHAARHPVERFTGALFARKGKDFNFIHGSAFIISPGFALTAAHVIDDYLEKIENKTLQDGLNAKATFSFAIVLMIYTPEGKSMHFKVRKINYTGPSDIALLFLEPEIGIDWLSLAPYPTIRLNPPNILETIYCYGFPNCTVHNTEDGILHMFFWPTLTCGTVDEIYELKRDKVLLNYPSYHITALAKGGMSGGPVTDSAGNICGVVVRSFDLEESEEHIPITFVATLWPALSFVTDERDGIAKIEQERLIDIFGKNFIKSIDIKDFYLGYNRAENRAFIMHKTIKNRCLEIPLKKHSKDL